MIPCRRTKVISSLKQLFWCVVVVGAHLSRKALKISIETIFFLSRPVLKSFFFVPTMMARMNVVLGSKMTTHKIQIRRSFLSFTRYLLTLGSDCPCVGVCCCARFYLSCCWVQACFGLGLLHGIIKITETQAAAAFRIGSID